MVRKIVLILMAFIVLFGIYTADATVKLVSSLNNYTGLSTDTKPSGTTVPTGSIFVETDKGRSYIYNGSSWTLKTISSTTDTVALFAPANGVAASAAGFETCIVYYTISAINTSVTTALQLKAGNGGWASVGSDSLIVTTNGVHGLEYTGVSAADSVRFKWISEAGGTTAVIIYNTKMSNTK